METKKFFRRVAGYVIGVASLVIAFSLFPVFPSDWVYEYVVSWAPEGSVETVYVTDGTIKAIELRTDFSKRLFEASIISLGAVWGFAFLEDRRRRVVLATACRQLVFASISLFLVSSCYAHFKYSFLVTSELSAASVSASKEALGELPDLDLFEFQVLLYWQVAALLIAITMSGILLFWSFVLARRCSPIPC